MKIRALAVAASIGLLPILSATGNESDTSDKTTGYADSIRAYEAQRDAIVQQRGVTESVKTSSSEAALIDAEVPTQDSPMALGE